ncbi:hypothetical protein E8E12_011751 [Didymella heteroderae]|uniref:Uncharacterized protein n=1 Tax=Didymella heteroderae TaxID=1769908 RepID=A0A9P4X262_9PLEO|nr:hypothetical protein E8E12_011751 [Didymella heteroderae]
MPNFVSFDLRWHGVFQRFAQTLKKLRTFRFGESEQWDFDTLSQFAETDTPGYPLPIMPWKDEHNLIPAMVQHRYVIWDDWDQQYRSQWKQKDETHYSEERVWRVDWAAMFEPPPDCQRDDEDALQVLLQAVRYN